MTQFSFSSLANRLTSLLLVLWLTTPFTTHADSLRVTVGLSKPPYVIEQGNTGFEIDLIKAIFTRMGHSLTFQYVPYARSSYMLKRHKADIVMTINGRTDIGAQASLSQPYITYKNVAISLRSKRLSIRKIADLAPYAIVGFQNSSTLLGNEFNRVSKKSRKYIELSNQQQQVEMLHLERTDVIVMDVNIFNSISKGIFGENNMQQVNIHSIFPTSPYSLGFNSQQLRQSFDRELVEFKASAAYIKLVDKYQLY